MASEVELCNTALSRLGDVANVSSISPPDGSAQAEYCKTFYPIARDTAQGRHQWTFTIRRAQLAQVSFPFSQWQYAYAAPANLIDVISVLPPDAQSDFEESQDYSLESLDDGTQVILTNQVNAILRFTIRVTDTTKFTALFNDAIAWLLASYLAGPLLKGDVGATAAQSCYKSFELTLAKAASKDANNQKRTRSHVVPWIKNR